MIPHHSGAILMCEQANITDPEVRKLCEAIVKSQREEIAQMKAKLEELENEWRHWTIMSKLNLFFSLMTTGRLKKGVLLTERRLVLLATEPHYNFWLAWNSEEWKLFAKSEQEASDYMGKQNLKCRVVILEFVRCSFFWSGENFQKSAFIK